MSEERHTTTRVLTGTLRINDGPEQPVAVEVRSTYVSFQIRAPVTVDFQKLRESGELDDEDLRTLEHGYSDAPILLMGEAPASFGRKNVCIGILTGKHVYPKNMFFISEATAVNCCTPTGEPPVKIEPYD